MKIFITGFSGAGKTTFGEKFSKDDNFQVFDLDEEIFNRMGSGYDSLEDYINEIGIEEFRHDELDMVKLLHQNMKDNYLISLGAGALTIDDVRSFISSIGAKIIHIDCSFEECWKRLMSDGNRPLAKKGRDYMEKLYNERRSVYQNSDLTLDQDSLSEVNTVDELLKLLSD